MNEAPTISTMRLYGAAIAFASGGYSVAMDLMGSSAAMTFMLVLGVVVVLHGAVLLTPSVTRLGAASGPLMLAYAVLMLANQAWMATIPMTDMMGRDGMDAGMMGGSASMMGGDPGMAALALLMLASGAIMTVRREML